MLPVPDEQRTMRPFRMFVVWIMVASSATTPLIGQLLFDYGLTNFVIACLIAWLSRCCRPGCAREAMWNWPEERLHHVRSFVYSHLGDMRRAVEAQDRTLASYTRPFSQAAVQVQMHRAMSMIASGDPSQGARHVVAMLETLEPAFRPGLVGTAVEFALGTLPERSKGLPEVGQARELVSAGLSS